ncbi:iron complex outermembrane recepter protein [Pedobacter steynii]|uniref:Iron complex outermembrane recepter protein n=1 Tax=Pedobacter steynii TaxID=430522 RepID=A0A1G9U8G7_9SPHI|nr:TonB-dependent receptor [Pedobacter steynii]NQX40696.1 TonB-dependent receptor [Pedobacter steynii]SDM56306.1 iron complex outermembrane recepter protein [Pedobacter steynii]
MYKRCTQRKQFVKFLFLICSILYLPYSSYGQQNQVLEKTLSLQLKNVALGDALKALGDKAGVQFSYSSTQLNTQRKVSVDFSAQSLRAALSDLLGQELKGLSVSGTQITIQTSGGKGSIKGTVKTSDGKAAEFVTVGIKGLKSAQVDAKGNYLLKDLEAGKYTLIASFVGLGVQKKEVTVVAGETVSQNFVLVESNDQLEEVVINGGSTNKFSVKKTTTSAKMPLGNLENPQVYTTIPKTLLTEQMVTEFSMALKNSPGVYKVQGSRGINSEGASYYSMRGFRSEAALMDGVPSQTNGEVEPANIERVELIKGPSGTLFGGAVVSFGGLINIVTKKPVDTLGGEVSFTTGSYGLRRLSADVYGPADQVDKDKKLLFRMNAAYQDQKSFQDAGFRKSIFFAPSLEYRASKRLNISVNAGFYQLEGTSPSVIFLNRTRNYIAKVPGDLNFDWNRSYTNNELTMKNPTLNFRGQVTYKLSGQWTSQTIYSINSRKSDGFYQYQFIRGAKDNMMERTISKQYSVNTSRDLQQNFTGDFNLFGLRNRMVIGFDYLNQTVRNNSSPYIVFDSVDGTNPADANYGKINRSAVEAGLAKSTGLRTWNNGENNIYGAYASNVLNLSDRLMAMLSLRVDRFQNKGSFNLSNNQRTGQYLQTAVSPKLGLVYQVLKDRISLFGNYMNGFSNVAPVTQPEGSGASSTFKPQQSNQFEGGAKMDLFQGKLSFTASVYDIEVNNMTWREDITVNGKNYPVTLQGGTQKSRGVELELIANPVQGLNIIAGYAYNDSKLIEGTPALEGRRPAFAGPSVLINSWISYAIPGGYLKGLGLGTGVNYIGKHITGNSAITGVFTLPSYVMATATVFYDKPKYRLGFKVDNLTDELYFTGIGVLSPQVPRTFAANATFKF